MNSVYICIQASKVKYNDGGQHGTHDREKKEERAMKLAVGKNNKSNDGAFARTLVYVCGNLNGLEHLENHEAAIQMKHMKFYIWVQADRANRWVHRYTNIAHTRIHKLNSTTSRRSSSSSYT